MKNKFAALVAGLGAILGLQFLTPVPAQAAFLTDLTHACNDAGYNALIIVTNMQGNRRYLDNCQTQMPANHIIVGYAQEVYCENSLPPYQSIRYYAGEHNLPSYASLKCWMQRG